MIAVNGKEYRTMKEAAIEFGVSKKTVYTWIDDGSIDPPPTITQGRKEIWIFPDEYTTKAKRQIQEARRARAKVRG